MGLENRKFRNHDEILEFDILDFWRFSYSSLWSQRDKIAEFIVSKALEIRKPINNDVWWLYDILYEGIRVEVKQTSMFQVWRGSHNPSPQPKFSIEGAFSEYKNPKSKFCRQNDVYVFCLNTGVSRMEADPLNLEHWLFYIMRTDEINRLCDRSDSKTLTKSISLSRLDRFVAMGLAYRVPFEKIKSTIDGLFLYKERIEMYARQIERDIIVDMPSPTQKDKKNIHEWVRFFLDSDIYGNESHARLLRGSFNGEEQVPIIYYDTREFGDDDSSYTQLTYYSYNKIYLYYSDDSKCSMTFDNIDVQNGYHYAPSSFFHILNDVLNNREVPDDGYPESEIADL